MKKICYLLLMICTVLMLTGCTISGTQQNNYDTQAVANRLTNNQKTPTDIEYSLERYNLIKRAYWINGMREKAAALPCAIEKPIGYVYCLSYGNVVAEFAVDGKISSLNSFLSPDSEYYETNARNNWLADVDGSYGTNSDGIFFFTVDGLYIEWKGEYLYSDIPFNINNILLLSKDGE